MSGRYRLETQLARGGMSVVWRATDTTTGQQVALKVLAANAGGAAEDRLRREYILGRHVSHPNLVRILDVGTLPNGRKFVAQELLAGDTLQHALVVRGPLEIGEALQLVLPLCGALGVLHDHGILHRDVKPTNVLLLRRRDAPPVPKLLDLGAAFIGDSARLTDPGRTIGTPGFMPPEQARGGRLSEGTDVWSLAATLFACLSGHMPYSHAQVAAPKLPALQLEELPQRAYPLLPAIAAALAAALDARTPDPRTFAQQLLVCARARGIELPPDPDPVGLPAWVAWLADAPGACATTRSLRGDTTSCPPQGAECRAPIPEPGAILANRFRLVTLLGEGCSGPVFAAIDDNHPSLPIALKLLRRPDPRGVYDFKHEFRALSEVRHPNIVTPHELSHDEAHGWFFTMDRVAGVHWLDHVRPTTNGPCDLERLHDTLLQLVRALMHLHGEGLLHRDIKPSNVLVTAQGEVKVVDFGLASPGAVGFRGTPAYAAPEQAGVGRVGPACDWYALGVMVYEALAGELPFRGTAEQILAAKALGCEGELQSQVAPLWSELSASGREYLRLALRLLRPDPDARPTGRELLGWLPDAPLYSEQVPPPEPPFVGRAHELAALDDAFFASREGGPVVLLVQGESGLGKTMLCSRFAQLKRADGALVLEGRCRLQEAVPFRALDQIVDGLLGYLTCASAEQRDSFLPQDFGELCQLFPVLRMLKPEGVPREATTPQPRDVRSRAFAAFRALVRAVARRVPLVLLIDDLQWGDRDSGALLRGLLASDKPAFPCLLVGVVRPAGDDCGPFVQELREGGLPDAELRFLHLTAMRDRDVEALSSTLLPRERLATLQPEIVRACAGHPMFAVELCRALQLDADNPLAAPRISLESALATRLARLSSEARDVLALICLCGHRLSRDLVVVTLPASTPGVMRELLHERALCETTTDSGAWLEPYHDRLRAVVTKRVPRARRVALLARLGECALQHSEPQLEIAVDAFLEAGHVRRAAALAEQAAESARRALAFNRAAELLTVAHTHAASLQDRRRVAVLLADAYVRAGRGRQAAERYLEASSLSEGGDRLVLQSQAMAQYLSTGHITEGMKLLNELSLGLGLKAASPNLRSPRPWVDSVRLLLGAGPTLRRPGAAKMQAQADDQVRLRVLWYAAMALAEAEPGMSADYVAASLHLAARLGESVIYAQASAMLLTSFPGLTGRPIKHLDRSWERTHTLVRRHGDAWDVAVVDTIHGLEALYTGRLHEALAYCSPVASATMALTERGLRAHAVARFVCAAALHWLGNVAQLDTQLAAWLDEAQDSGDRHQIVSLTAMGVIRHLRADDPDTAERELARIRSLELGYTHTVLTTPRFCVAHLLYSGRAAEALRWCDEALPRFRARWGMLAGTQAAWALSYGAAVAQLVAQGKLTGPAARPRLAPWIRRLRLRRMPFARAVTRQLQAYLAVLAGDRTHAESLLQHAITLYDAQGMRLHAASVRLHLAQLQPSSRQADGLAAAAHRVFRQEGIQAPNRWMATLAPLPVPDEHFCRPAATAAGAPRVQPPAEPQSPDNREPTAPALTGPSRPAARG